MDTGFLFAGQGSQTIGMATALCSNCADCREVFAAADSALGRPLSSIVAEGPDSELRRTEIAQPALVTLAVAEARHLMDKGIEPQWLIGHSLGEFAALVVAGALDFASAVRLVAERGRLMQEVVPEGRGSMAAILGIDRRVVYEACRSASDKGVADVACHNAPGQTVISGELEAVQAASNRLEELGATVVPLPVSAPFHCRLLTPMVEKFKALVDGAALSDPRLPVIDNVTALPLHDAEEVRRNLVTQLTAPVLFEESLLRLSPSEHHRLVQCGPGRSLLSMAKKVIHEGDFETFEEAADGGRNGSVH